MRQKLKAIAVLAAVFAAPIALAWWLGVSEPDWVKWADFATR